VDLAAAELDRARRQHDAEYMSWPFLSTFVVGFDVSRPPFDDPQLRRAFVLAADRETLAAVVDHGNDFPATGGFIPPGMPGHSPEIGLPYDPEQARRLMAEAGYPGGSGFPLTTFLIPAFPRIQTACDYLQMQWQETLGVPMIREFVERIDWPLIAHALYNTPREHDRPQMYFGGWAADYPDPDSFLRVGLAERWTRWRHDGYARLVEQARRSADQRARLDSYRQADRIVIEEALIMPLTYARTHWLLKPWVKKYPTSPIRVWFWKDVIIEPHE